jgi:hypothetical protein
MAFCLSTQRKSWIITEDDIGKNENDKIINNSINVVVLKLFY